mgnify:CR=1 FL=1
MTTVHMRHLTADRRKGASAQEQQELGSGAATAQARPGSHLFELAAQVVLDDHAVLGIGHLQRAAAGKATRSRQKRGSQQATTVGRAMAAIAKAHLLLAVELAANLLGLLVLLRGKRA